MVEKTAGNVQLIFTSTTGRSGTRYLTNLINANSLNATSEHDPFPRGYGAPLKWYDDDKKRKLEKLSKKKLQRLSNGKSFDKVIPLWNRAVNMNIYKRFRSYRLIHAIEEILPSVRIKDIYLESTQAFIKSFAEAMYELVPNLWIIHLTRDPLQVAKSFLNRGSIPTASNPYLLSPSYKKNELKMDMNMTDYQKCLWYWFETELRHSKFMENHHVEKVYDIDIYELNNKEKVRDMFDFFGIAYKGIDVQLGKNANPVVSKIDQKNKKEAKEFVEKLPEWVFDRIKNTYDIKANLEEG